MPSEAAPCPDYLRVIVFLGIFVSFPSQEFFPFNAFTINFEGTNYFGYAVDYAFVASVSADQIAAIIDVNIAGFLVEAEALNRHCRLG